jgi:hypothetical protein
MPRSGRVSVELALVPTGASSSPPCRPAPAPGPKPSPKPTKAPSQLPADAWWTLVSADPRVAATGPVILGHMCVEAGLVGGGSEEGRRRVGGGSVECPWSACEAVSPGFAGPSAVAGVRPLRRRCCGGKGVGRTRKGASCVGANSEATSARRRRGVGRRCALRRLFH